MSARYLYVVFDDAYRIFENIYIEKVINLQDYITGISVISFL